MFRWIQGCILAGSLVVAPAFADEGRIPIYEKTTISAPGSYVVTRDIVIDTDYAIRIDASPVRIDLNGFTLRSTDWGRMILLTAAAKDVVIRNGRIADGTTGIHGEQAGNNGSVRVEDVVIRNMTARGISLAFVDSAAIAGCTIADIAGDAIYVAGADEGGGRLQVGVRVVSNMIRNTGRGIDVRNNGSVIIHGNVLQDVGAATGATTRRAIYLSGAGVAVIADNAIRCAADNEYGIYLEGSTVGASIDGNTVAGCGVGMDLRGVDTEVIGNTVTDSATHGIVVWGSQTVVDRNILTDNGDCGFQSSSSSNAYRNNYFRNNTTAAVCGPTTDAGGNLFL